MIFTPTKILSVCAAVGVVLAAGTTSAQIMTLINPTTNNGSFESNTNGTANKTFFTTTTSSTAAVPYWGVTTSEPDTGVQSGVNINEDGLFGAFEQPGATIFNLVTSRPIALGDMYTLTFYGKDTQTAGSPGGGMDAVSAIFYAQTPPTAGAAYGYTPTAVLSTTAETLTNAGFAQYTINYTALTANVGQDIGIELDNTGLDYNGVDNFVLTVTPAVPEPSTYALLAVGLGGLLFLRRRTLA